MAKRLQYVIEVSPDPVPGAFHYPEDIERDLEQMLKDRIPHYLPMVAYLKEVDRAVIAVGHRDADADGGTVHLDYRMAGFD